MKRMDYLRRIPKPVRACFWAVATLIMAVVYYIVLGCPTLTFEQEFRRAEKTHLVGPSNILATDEDTDSGLDNLIIGETQEGMCIFARYTYSGGNTGKEETGHFFNYLKKTDSVTLFAAPTGINWSFAEFQQTLPVYLVTSQPEAHLAKITIHIQGAYTKHTDWGSYPSVYDQTFHAEASRSDTGIFVFDIEADRADGLSALWELSTVTGGNIYNIPASKECTIAATVQLYDTDGNLILEKELPLHP